MPKLERLVQLARLIHDRRVVSVDQMCQACGVSYRTIYRYLNTLGRLDQLSSGRDHRSRSSSRVSHGGSLSPAERELLAFVLRHNALVETPFLANHVRTIRELLEAHFGALPEPKIITSVDSSARRSGPAAHCSGLAVEVFLTAAIASRLIRIRLKGRRGPAKAYLPKGLEVDAGRLKLLLSEPGKKRVTRIDSERVESIKPAP